MGVGTARSDAPYPVLVVDRVGDVVEANEAARGLLLDQTDESVTAEGLPRWLAEAHGRLRTTGTAPGAVQGAVAGRTFVAHPSPAEGGDVVWWLVENTDLRLAEQALHSERERAALLAEISGALLSSLNVDRCTEVTARMAADHLADAAVIVAPAQGRRHSLTYAQVGGEVTQVMVPIDAGSVPGLAEALRGFPPVPTRWLDPDDLPGWVVPPGFDRPIGSVIVTPLPGHGMPAGVLILLRSSTHRAFTDGEEVFARLFAARAGAALSAARLYAEQASITATLLRELLPPRLERVHGVEYAGAYRASQDHERVGGDFYDVHPGADPADETFVVLGDVAGKGLEAAVLTGKIRSVLHALLPLSGDHQQVLGLLNGALLNSHHTRFATLVLASVRRSSEQVRLRLTSAGHLPPLIVRGDGRVEEAATSGTLVGALPDVRMNSVDVVLAPGETCLLYTDGITEARGGPLGDQLYGEARLRDALRECARMPAEAVVERVQMLAAQWLESDRHDDMATLAITNPVGGHGTPEDANGLDGHHPHRGEP
ncbi:PP2C family protein-serine/threonine phosphatase [Streptomyces sp. Root1310]|uniref:PP2C family protein-serine/threonine phosphatase n=1 Tax=Streptomyces sp. Root1310 TaxID=1736452 RepID=UPI0007103B63|nr:PP2C family protein-serine/threonine phosphatase [Streptomyces sp. Root1310]KQX65154.1 serine/threonine protein phosphatase [Streptomyces sp. Root1310]